MKGNFLRCCRLVLLVIFCGFTSVVLAMQSSSQQAGSQQASFNPQVYSPSLQAFSDLPTTQNLALSPSGEKIAYIQNIPSPKNIALLRVLDMSGNDIVQRNLFSSDNKKIKINWFEWINDNYLLLSVKNEVQKRDVLYFKTRMIGVDLSGDKIQTKPIIRMKSNFSVASTDFVSQFQDNVVDFLPDDPDHILVGLDLEERSEAGVYRINVHTARQKRIQRRLFRVRDWYTDQQHVVRIGYARSYDTGEIKYWHRKSEDDNFEVLFSYTSFEDKPIVIKGFDLDPNILYFTQYNGDKKALYKMNVSTKETELVLAHENYDVTGRLLYSKKTKQAIGISDPHSPYNRFYFNKKDYNLIKSLDKALPDTNNYLFDLSADELKYLLYTRTDTSPVQYLYGDISTRSLSDLFSTYPKLKNAALASHQKVKYKARDGVEIEAILTLPLFGEKPFPVVVHPHGGPGARDFFGFDPWVAYMASRGYAVIRPNFRGSAGYGYDFAKAQMKRWGLEMQDDITDAAQYLVNEGIADKNKMCIFGASYGGYAAKMAAVKTPDMFACAISFAGVSDLNLLVEKQKDFQGGAFTAENQIGDNRKDLDSRSPINFVEKVKTPMLVMHGSEDRTVSIEQSRNFVIAMRNSNKNVRYVEFDYGDHYLSIAQNRARFFEELDAFLSQYLGVIEATKDNIRQ